MATDKEEFWDALRQPTKRSCHNCAYASDNIQFDKYATCKMASYFKNTFTCKTKLESRSGYQWKSILEYKIENQSTVEEYVDPLWDDDFGDVEQDYDDYIPPNDYWEWDGESA